MDGKIDLITLIALVVALVVILKLRSVLGRRTEDDDARLERYKAEKRKAAANGNGQDKVVTLPQRETSGGVTPSIGGIAVAEAQARIRSMAGKNADVERGLLDILKLDSQFDPEHFLTGAKQAYELIVTAFAEGNRKLLKDLLSREVFESFAGAIADRESRGEQVDQSFVGISKADIVDAETKEGIASVTVKFVSQLITATRDRAGSVIAGDPQAIHEVTDIWTFCRDVSSSRARSNPNWRLVATQAPG
ncbi:MAG: Tim44 domain-containing protein [Hyphomicrobiaceae bacterium]|nr:Tim44 domain-containing protein [Hyphomicrobiaceae bacterium]